MKKSKLLIIIPCYREEENLKQKLPLICRYLINKKIVCDLLVVEGEKLDNTDSVVSEFQKKYKFIKLISTHKGKGHQVKEGLKFGKYNNYLFMDADIATPLKYISIFLNLLKQNPEVGMITGIRVKRHGNLVRKTVSLTLNFMLRIFLGFKQTDTQCGFKLITKNLRDIVLVKQRNENWIFDIEYFISATKNKISILEVPIPDWKNDYERATLNTFPKFIKSSIQAGLELSSIILRSISGWYRMPSLNKKK